MKTVNRILWGIVLVGLGLVLALRAFDLITFDIFFDGWWTLFIIIPCGVGLFTSKDKTANIIGLGVGVLLLLSSQSIIAWDMVWKLIIPLIIVAIGIKLIFGTLFNKNIKAAEEAAKKASEKEKSKSEGKEGYKKEYSATFSGQKLKYDGQSFNGAELNAIFGGIDIDLRGAIIDEDCVINACAVFGGIDIFVPDGINVVVNSTAIFGGIDTKKRANIHTVGAPTVYVNGTCMFGGIDIK